MEKLYFEVIHAYDCFDIEENVLLMLEAKRNGFQGVPGVVDLVHNEEYKENALHESKGSAELYRITIKVKF